MTMRLSPQGAGFLRVGEGYVPRYYLDPVKIGTIGTGFTWRSEAFREWWGKNKPGQKFGPGATITREENDAALIFVMEREYGAAVNRFLGKDVPQHVFDGSSSVVFNCGAGTLDDRWAGQLKAGRYDEAADLLRTTRVTAKGKRLDGLVARRKEEGELIELGDYTVGVAIDAMADGILQRGERGREVKVLQSDLAALGLYDGIADGIFGFGTESAVMQFQRGAHLDDDGFAGPKTLAAIRQAREPADAPQLIATLAPTTVSTPDPSAATAPIVPIAEIIPPVVASPRPDLIGRPSAVVERILRDEGSRQIAKANAVIKKTIVNRAMQMGPGAFIVSIFASLGGIPWWVWAIGTLALISIGVVLFLSWQQADEAKAIKVARVDDAVTGNAAFGGPSPKLTPPGNA